MVAEINFENELVMKYLVNALEYTPLKPISFNSDLLFIPDVVKDFFQIHQNALCKQIIKKDFKGDEAAFWAKFLPDLSEYLYNSSHNIAIQLHPKRHGGFKFLGQYSFTLFYTYDQKEQDKNIYHVISQIPFQIKKRNGEPLIIKPDVGVFLNGFLISFMQLKIQHRGQSAVKEGRGQILGDYFEAISDGVIDHLSPTLTEEDKARLVFNATKPFQGPMHMVAMDTASAYVLRGANKYYADIEKELTKSKASAQNVRDEMLRNFFMDPVYIKESGLSLNDKMEKVLSGLYLKENIQQEILYLNFLKYDNQITHNGGKKQITKRGTPVLSFPRPNQKYGVNKVIREVLVKYQNENNPNYEIEKLEKKLRAENLSENLIQSTLEKRKAYKNNRKQYSVFLQYAAGFGKTNIICWLALVLKDLKEDVVPGGEVNNYLFSKIILLSDRVELRDQIDLAMSNMNIEKGLYKEAQTTLELSQYLSESNPRIIIVNIQKFPFLKDLVQAQDNILKEKRVAIVIDEIHRSNSGKQHTDMTTLFDEISEMSLGSDNHTLTPNKKNLIIGLTATPTDENLIRFGEYQTCLEDIKWKPLDAYTMKEAISDGFVLDPTKGIVHCALSFGFESVNQKDSELKRMPTTKERYESKEEYIEHVSKKVAEILLNNTFKKIAGYGKGMLAVYSIEAARLFYECINKELDTLTLLPKYQKYKEVKVYMVYSSTQEDPPAYKVCGYDSEKAVIAAFKAEKNGLMIVVDKLQTGFDEPRLHTLFLAKEIKAINAVQTICRVNRTFKNKSDSLIVDFSIDNVNEENIKNAFKKYSDVVVSSLDTFSVKLDVERTYCKIIKTEPYMNFFAAFKNKSGINVGLKMEEYVIKMLTNEYSKKILVEIGEQYLNYMQKMSLIENVIGLDDKYKDEKLIKFMVEILNLIKQKLNISHHSDSKEVIDFWFENLGLIGANGSPIEDESLSKLPDKKLQTQENDSEKYSILNILLRQTQIEKDKEELMQKYKTQLNLLFEKIVEYDKKSDTRLVLHVKEDGYQITEDFEKAFKGVARRLKNQDNPGIEEFIKEVKEHFTFLESDFVAYILSENF